MVIGRFLAALKGLHLTARESTVRYVVKIVDLMRAGPRLPALCTTIVMWVISLLCAMVVSSSLDWWGVRVPLLHHDGGGYDIGGGHVVPHTMSSPAMERLRDTGELREFQELLTTTGYIVISCMVHCAPQECSRRLKLYPLA
jgi:hypothetical protein